MVKIGCPVHILRHPWSKRFIYYLCHYHFALQLWWSLRPLPRPGTILGISSRSKPSRKKNVKSFVKSQHSVSKFCHLTFFFKLIFHFSGVSASFIIYLCHYHFALQLWWSLRPLPRPATILGISSRSKPSREKKVKSFVKSQHSVSRFCHWHFFSNLFIIFLE